jgi:hypothetical protein
MQLQIPLGQEVMLEVPRDRKPYSDRLKQMDRKLKSDLVSCVCGHCENPCARRIPKTDQKLSDSEK